MTYGLMKLNDDELEFLGGKIGVIDIQKGCNVQCFMCGANAPPFQYSMPWNNFMKISESILEVKSTKKIDLIIPKKKGNISLYWTSELPFYKSKDGHIERTGYDAQATFHKQHKIFPTITISGWNPEDNTVQHTMEQIVQYIIDNRIYTGVGYSIKAASAETMKEYLDFKKDFPKNKIPQDISEIEYFANNSKYTIRLANNMKTLNPLRDNTGYNIQCCDDEDMNSEIFTQKYGEYKQLFSKQFIEQVFKKAIDISGIRHPDQYKKRILMGVGKGITAGILEATESKCNKLLLNEDDDKTYNYSAAIDCDCRIKIYLGDNNSLAKKFIPKEHFRKLAEFNKHNSKEYQRYIMLSNLQGKRLID